MSIEYTVICDGCGRLLDASTVGAWAARKVVREQLGGAQQGAKDYCADCVASRRAQASIDTALNGEGDGGA